MTEADRQNVKRAVGILASDPARIPDSWPELLALLEKEIGQPAIASMMNLSLHEVLCNLTLADIAAMANGASK